MRRRMTPCLALVLLWVGTAGAQSPYPDRPVDLRVTGTLLPADGQKRDDLVTVNIFVRDTPLVLRIGKVEDLTAPERTRAVKDDVLLRQVRFSGANALMERMLKPEMLGRVLTIQGWLDTRERRFLVTSVEEATGAAPATGGK
jgi:hypothetical protein